MFYIYTITNLINYKMYVGQTSKPKERWSAHKCETTRNKKRYPIYLAMRKYGIKNFDYCIIYFCKDKDRIDQLEIEWIEELDARANGYNIMLGGNCGMRGRHHSNESKRKIRESQLGKIISPECRAKMSAAKKGKIGSRLGTKVSEETKKRLSQINIGRKASAETRKKMSEAAKKRWQKKSEKI